MPFSINGTTVNSDKMKCRRCGEIELTPVNHYYDTEGEWIEYECQKCHHYEQHRGKKLSKEILK